MATTFLIESGLVRRLPLGRTRTASDYQTTDTDLIVEVADTSVGRTVTLASATVAGGRVVIVKDVSGGAGTNNISVVTEGAETIDGAASVVINTNYGYRVLYSDGANWFVIGAG